MPVVNRHNIDVIVEEQIKLCKELELSKRITVAIMQGFLLSLQVTKQIKNFLWDHVDYKNITEFDVVFDSKTKKTYKI